MKRFSASSLNRWMTCPKQAHFKDVLDLPEEQHAKTTYGTIIHRCLDFYNETGDLDGSCEMFMELWEDPASIDAEITLWSKAPWTELRDHGLRCLENFHTSHKQEHREILASEYEFLVPFGDHTLSGTIDCLEIAGEGDFAFLKVTDYKTSSSKPTHIELRLNVQMTAYYYATLQPEFWVELSEAAGEDLYVKYKGMERKVIWHALWHGQEIDAGPRESSDFERLYRAALEIQNAIDKEVFIPNISASSCFYCSYTHLCEAVIPVAHIIKGHRDERFN